MASELIHVYDICGTGYFGAYTPVGKTSARLKSIKSMPNLMIESLPGENKWAYLLDDDKLIIDDLLDITNGRLTLSVEHLHSISQLLLACQDSDRQAVDLLRQWFSAMCAHVDTNALKNDKSFILPVPDRLSVDTQEQLLKAVRRGLAGSGCTLLWRSVAAFLGNAEALESMGLENGDKIAVVDYEKTGATISYLWMDDCDGRLIPAHRLFRDSDKGERIKFNYPYDGFSPTRNPEDELSITLDNGFIAPNEQSPDTPLGALDVAWSMRMFRGCKCVIVVGRILSEDLADYILDECENLVLDPNGESVALGAACFANHMMHGLTAYYDECEALSLVIQNSNEEILFKPLIKADKRLRSGLAIRGEVVDDVYLPDKNIVDFHLRLGVPAKDRPLKILSQEFTIPEDLEKKLRGGRSLELELHPSLVAGQGRAVVEIKAKKREYQKVFPPVVLDWEKMQDAIENGHIVTVSYLEEHMERSFPPDIPFVKSYGESYAVYSIERIVKYGSDNRHFYNIELNRPSYPNKDKKDISRFEKLNIFGVPTADSDGLPQTKDKRIFVDFFRLLNSKFLGNDKTASSDAMTMAAWTYHPKDVQDIMGYERKRFESMLHRPYGLTIQSNEASFCANMFQSKDDAVLFMRVFFRKLRTDRNDSGAVVRANNWYRAAYQVLMTNPLAINTLCKKYMDEVYESVGILIASYYDNLYSGQIRNNICRVLCALLKVRKVHKGFCRKDENAENSLDGACFVAINLLSSGQDENALKEFLERYQIIISSGFNEVNLQRVYQTIFMELSGWRKQAGFYDMLDRNKSSGTWGEILNLYLNSKGNLNMPVSDTGDDD